MLLSSSCSFFFILSLFHQCRDDGTQRRSDGAKAHDFAEGHSLTLFLHRNDDFTSGQNVFCRFYSGDRTVHLNGKHAFLRAFFTISAGLVDVVVERCSVFVSNGVGIEHFAVDGNGVVLLRNDQMVAVLQHHIPLFAAWMGDGTSQVYSDISLISHLSLLVRESFLRAPVRMVWYLFSLLQTSF